MQASSSSSLLEKNGLTDEQIAIVVAVRKPDEIAEHVAALPYRRPRKPAATLFAALKAGWDFPEEYVKARARAAAAKAQMELRAADELEQRRAIAAAAADERTPEQRREVARAARAALPESMRRRLAGESAS